MKFHTEKGSIDFFKTQLIQSGFTSVDCTQVTDKYCYYDIQAEYNNKKCRFELKNRSENLKSTTYGDSMIELYKYGKFVDDIVNNKISMGYVVSLFEDIYTIHRITDLHSIDQKNCPSTTYFENTNKKDKYCVTYPINEEHKYYY